MNAPKKQKLSARTARQIDIISKYYDVDHVNRLIYVEYEYDKVSDILESDVKYKKPFIKNELLENISSVIASFPKEYRVSVSFKINDYEGHDPVAIGDSFKDILEIFHYSVHHETSRRWLSAAILFIISAVLIAFRLFLKSINFIVADSMVDEMMDITSWAFLWEAVTVLFLSPGELKEVSMKLGRRLVSITFLNKDNKAVFETKRNELVANWIQDTKLESGGRILLIVSAALILSNGIIDLINGFYYFIQAVAHLVDGKSGFQGEFMNAGVTLIGSAIFIIGGIAAINAYRERGRLRQAMPFFAYAFLIFDLFVLAGSISILILNKVSLQETIHYLTQTFISLFSSIAYFVSYILMKKYQKREIAFELSQKNK